MRKKLKPCPGCLVQSGITVQYYFTMIGEGSPTIVQGRQIDQLKIENEKYVYCLTHY